MQNELKTYLYMICCILILSLQNKLQTIVFELMVLTGEIINTINNLDEWMKPEHVKKDLANIINTLCIQQDPLGVVCVFSAWNYPVSLLLQPLIGAIAAGTVCIALCCCPFWCH